MVYCMVVSDYPFNDGIRNAYSTSEISRDNNCHKHSSGNVNIAIIGDTFDLDLKKDDSDEDKENGY